MLLARERVQSDIMVGRGFLIMHIAKLRMIDPWDTSAVVFTAGVLALAAFVADR